MAIGLQKPTSKQQIHTKRIIILFDINFFDKHTSATISRNHPKYYELVRE